MKYYKDYDVERAYIGNSDVAGLTVTYCDKDGVKSKWLSFGCDGDYSAYVIDEEYEIPGHYNLTVHAKAWVKIFDDQELVRIFKAPEIKIYRVGNYGCIIQLIGKKAEEQEEQDA